MLALADEDDSYVADLRAFWRETLHSGEGLKGIVVLSAHSLTDAGTDEAPVIEVTAGSNNRLDYDFGGFPGELYEVQYACAGDPSLAARIAGLLTDSGFSAALSTESRLDHGVWVPLRAMAPEIPGKRIPVVRVSLPAPSGNFEPRIVLKLGKALAPLRGEGVLLVGSGGAVHNLGQLHWYGKSGPAAEWASAFEEWILGRLEARDVEALVSFAEEAPAAMRAHPTPEHFLPLLFTVGAAWKGEKARILHRGIEYHSLSMLCLALMPEASRMPAGPELH